MQKSFCDRCGKEIEGHVLLIPIFKDKIIKSVVSGFNPTNAVKLVYKSFPDVDLDLCMECTMSLEKWFKEGKS